MICHDNAHEKCNTIKKNLIRKQQFNIKFSMKICKFYKKEYTIKNKNFIKISYFYED